MGAVPSLRRLTGIRRFLRVKNVQRYMFSFEEGRVYAWVGL